MKSKFCGKCGNNNAEGMSFCLQCGSSLEQESKPVNSFEQQPSISPNQFQSQGYPSNPPPISPPAFNQPADNYQPFQPNFNQPDNAGFLQSAEPKKGIGSKILSVLGSLAVGIFILLKFGLVFIRAGRFGIIGVIIAAVAIIGIYAVISIFKRS
jgi:hypothetical protein